MDSFSRDGLTFDVTDAGPVEGEVVILLHGFPQDRTAWSQVTEQLNATGLRTLAPDQRGYSPGASPTARSAYAMRELVADVVALADAANAQTFHVVGHDWGGAVAWAVAAAHPDRVASATVLSTPHPTAMAWAFTHGDQARRSWYMVTFQIPRLPEKRLHRGLRSLYLRTGMDADQAQRYVDRFPTPESLTPPMNWYRGMPASAAIGRSVKKMVSRRRGGGHSGPRKITVPTTYVWGRRDFALGRAAAEKTAEFVSADYRFVEVDAGHWLPEVEAEVVAHEIIQRVRPHLTA
ncbi:alpha/beta fold hydrolase [Demetria terragena]|uniref:alpha/beta fold hydrolase n=1 Tax=Demetria terragena TaxID=63959 RepID=UPI000380F658|nr:alpha/beta hydrolase [Demetria terragena]